MDGTVLIADDDRTIRTVLTQAFTRAGCKVHATSSLVTLMRWVEDGKGDFVVSDVVMPDGNGLENLPKITKMRPNLPVIIISAQNTIVTAIRANEAKAFDYLPKPFDLPELMHRAVKALERRHPPQVTNDETEAQDAEIPQVGHFENRAHYQIRRPIRPPLRPLQFAIRLKALYFQFLWPLVEQSLFELFHLHNYYSICHQSHPT